ncbi:MAG: hemerythrin domain-containing protein [Alphaproteobacteria bacterium]|jgi:hemerythrin-like domain-containing protein|nr:hemerythrin domain-containing protein [Alphaproteobacteria bacterium]MDP6567533.1 hemerythrin domain-containing protein [Alphaproteobacteria bacterium]
MQLIDALMGEHGAFNALFDTIEKLAETSGELAQIDSAMAVLMTEVDVHARLEIELIFPALENQPGIDELFAEIQAEHEEIRRGLHRIEDARDISEAMEAVRYAMDVARRHFEKEENVLYPMAQRALDDDAQVQLANDWATARHVMIA